MERETIVHLEKKALKRRLGIFDLFAVGYGDLGSSIYYALGVTALYALGATPIALGLAGIVFICTCLSYAEMSSAFPESGGAAAYARYAFNDLVSFIAGWGLLLDYIVTIAISAFAVPAYLARFLDVFGITLLDWVGNQIVASIIVIGILFILNMRGIKESTTSSIVLTFFTIVSQVIIIAIAGFFLLNIKDVIHHLKIGAADNPFSPTWPEFWKGTAMAMVAYTGIESITQLASETKNPTKVIKGSIKITMYTLLAIYIGISIVALSAISPHDLGTKYIDDPVAGIALALPFGSSILTPWIGLIAAFIIFAASNSGLIGSSRLSYYMGQHYQIPKAFYHLHSKYQTPYIALAFFAILAIIVIVLSKGQLQFLADLYNFGAMIAFFFCHLSLIVLRVKKPDLARPYRSPLNIPFGKHKIPITAIIGVLATFSVWVLIVITKPAGRYMGVLWILFGVAMYFYHRKKKMIAPTAKITLEPIRVSYTPLVFKTILVAMKSAKNIDIIQAACEIAKLHKAKVHVVYAIEIPLALPFDIPLAAKVKAGEHALKQAEAVGRENNIPMDFHLIRARSIKKAILDVLKEEKPDLVILGASHLEGDESVAKSLERPLRQFSCKVWICQ